MHDTIVGLLEKADLAIAFCAGVIGEDDLEPMARSVRDARIRISYPEDMSVVALVGGTGSGKSSLANAVCGADVAMVGGARPTTGEPLAIVAEARAGDIGGYLDALGVSVQVTVRIPPWLCLIDMPDTDSVEIEHRLRVEQLLPRLDIVVWVVDPEKYRDAALHNRYLKPLSPYSNQFIFVLNQIDRLAPAVIESVVADLEKALREDGIESPRIVATAVNPASGPPIGVSDLVDALEEAVNDDRVFEKLLVDLAQGSAGLLDATGGTGLEFETRARAVLETTARMVVDGQTRSAIDELTLFLEAIANEAGGSTGSRVRQIAALVPSHVESVADGVKTSTPIENRRRFRARRSNLEASRAEQRDAAGEILDDLVIDPTRGALAARAQANAALADLSLSVEKARAVTTR
jgi:hypothetical protein